MSHKKLLKQGKISQREYQDLQYFKEHGMKTEYKTAERGYSERPKGFRRDHPDPYGQHIQRAEATR